MEEWVNGQEIPVSIDDFLGVFGLGSSQPENTQDAGTLEADTSDVPPENMQIMPLGITGGSEQVRHVTGTKSAINANRMGGDIGFSTDTQEILYKGKPYGISITQADNITRFLNTVSYGNYIDLRDEKYDRDTYYPVGFNIYGSQPCRFIFWNVLAGSKPSWATHTNGFRCCLDVVLSGLGWNGDLQLKEVLHYAHAYCDVNPIASLYKSTKGGFDNKYYHFIYFRGGGHYYFKTSKGVIDFKIYTEKTSYIYQDKEQYSVEPTTTPDRNIKVNTHAVTAETVKSLGIVAASALASTYPDGISTAKVFNGGWPVTYGNVLTLNGDGSSQLIMEWSGVQTSTAKNVPLSMYLRGRRDTQTEWSEPMRVAFFKDLLLANITNMNATWKTLLQGEPNAPMTRWPTISEVTGKTNLIIKANGGTVEGTSQWTYNGVTAKTINITPALIGAAPSSHTHTLAQISNLHSDWREMLQVSAVQQMTRWPTWSEVTGKPTTFTPATHTHDYIVGRYSGSGGVKPPNYVGTNALKLNMMRANPPEDKADEDTAYADWILMNAYSWSDVPYATAIGVSKKASNPRAWIMCGPNSDDRSTWSRLELARKIDIPTSMAWSAVTGKPSTFAPSTHDHNVDSITDISSDWKNMLKLDAIPQQTRWPSWNEVTGKPTYYACDTLDATDLRTVVPNTTGISTKKAIKAFFRSALAPLASGYMDFLVFDTYMDSTGGRVNALGFSKNSMSIVHAQGAFNGTSWDTVKELAYKDEIKNPPITYAAELEGATNTVDGKSGFAIGEGNTLAPTGTTTNHPRNIVLGYENSVTNMTTAIGWGLKSTGTVAARKIVMGAYNSATSIYYTLQIGGGSSDTNRKDNLTLSSGGDLKVAGTVSGSGADYAELFEWADGGGNEDRAGLFVTITDGDRIRLADSDDEVLGVVSATACMIGGDPMDWHRRWLTDSLGRYLTNEDGSRVVNPQYRADEEYIPRSMRKEWGTIGLLGRLRVRDDGSCKVGGKCTVGNSGKATAGDRWIVLKRIAPEVVEILYR